MAFQRRDAFRDYVQEQGKLVSQVLKERTSADEWEKNWGFYKNQNKILEEEAMKKGYSPEKYWDTVKELQKKPYPKRQPIDSNRFSEKLPMTSNAFFGWRCNYKLEKKDPPLVPPLLVPEKTNVIFLG